jgi:hypothetical protein
MADAGGNGDLYVRIRIRRIFGGKDAHGDSGFNSSSAASGFHDAGQTTADQHCPPFGQLSTDSFRQRRFLSSAFAAADNGYGQFPIDTRFGHVTRKLAQLVFSHYIIGIW